MIVAFDGHVFYGPWTGVATYSAGLLRALAARRAPGDRLALYFLSHRRAPAAAALRAECGIESWRSRAPFRLIREMWRRCGGPPLEWLVGRADVFHSTNFTPPATRAAKSVVTIHDLYFLKVPEHADREGGGYFARYLAARVEKADLVVVDSEATRRDVERFFPRVAARTRVVYPGFEPRAAPQPVPAGASASEPFFLFVGRREPRKNLVRTIEAYRRAAASDPGLPPLVLVGPKGKPAYEAAIAASAAPVGERVRVVGYVDPAALDLLYARAVAVLYASIDEGFGYPVLEAFAAGTPVLASTAGSVPEVAGDAALLVDPLDVEAIAAGMVRLARDAALREALVARGRARLALFTWDACARKMRALYESLLGGGGA